MNSIHSFDLVRRSALRVTTAAFLAITGWAGSAHAAQCMGDRVGNSGLNCTANDFALTGITITNLVDGCTGIGDTYTFDGLFGVASGNSSRYDVGFYVGADGVQSYTGQCYVTTIPIGPGYADLDHDMCGDYNGSAFTLPVTGVTSKCVDTDNNGFYDLSVCVSWDNNTMPDCTGPDDAFPATKSKCECEIINTNLATPRCTSNADCPTDNNPCTDEVCHVQPGSGGDSFGCSHDNNTKPCNDGQFCTATDTCSNGSCVGTGNPCSTGPVCNNTCNEAADNCLTPGGTNCTSDGNPCTVDQCNGAGTCAHTAGNGGAVCRASAGICDVAETCNGSSTSCPADGFAGTGTVCRAAASVCDVAETCTGTGASCPANGFAGSGTVCRAASGVCDVQEVCTGTSGSCPSNSFLGTGTVCRESAGVCDTQEVCSGTSANCPGNSFAGTGTVCRSSSGVCDSQEVCSGTGASCPADTMAGTSTVCRAASGACDVAERCTGSSTSCPADGFAGTGTVCRAASGACDVAESCTGADASCPADSFAGTGTVCRAAAGVCDTAESCTGTSGDCPSNSFAGTDTVCRSSAGVCDTAEVCSGSGAGCPADGFAGTGTVCREASGSCDVQEVCSGSGAGCPADGFAGTGTVCREASGACDVQEVCSGSAADCPADSVAGTSTVCRASTGVCDTEEVCDGSDSSCPADSFAGTGTLCRAATGVCDTPESCDGSSNDCPADAAEPTTTVCRAATGECDVAENCDGTGNSCPADSFVPEGTGCSSDENVCTDDQCDGAGACGHTANTAPCDDELFCNGTDTCADTVCQHTGDPCTGADGDGNCSESCDETSKSCTGKDPDGSVCDDGLFCNGGPDHCLDGLCQTHPGFPCDDGIFCTDDTCDEMAKSCAHPPKPNDTPCDDEDICTLDDVCISGVCEGEQSAMLDLCPWIVVERQDPRRDTLKLGVDDGIDGDVCGGNSKTGNGTVVDGDLASNKTTGTKALRLTPDALVTEDIVSAGAGAKARPGSAKLPMLDAAVSSLPPGSLTAKSTPPGGFYDLTGAHPLAADCDKARNGYPAVMAVLDPIPPSQSLPEIRLKSFATYTFTASTPGGLNVIDTVQLRTGRNITLEFDGGGNPDTVFVLRVAKKFKVKLSSKISLINGTQAQNVLIYVKGKKCALGDLMDGSGTVFCANGRLKMGRNITWLGTFYGAGHILKVGDTNLLTYKPFLGF